MIELLAANLAPIMFIIVMGLLMLGYPVAFTLAAGGLGFFAIGVGMSQIFPGIVHLSWPLLQAQPDRIFGILSNDTLLAVPFFTLMGAIFQRTGIAEELLEIVARLFGRVRGGLCFAVVLVGALLAATTGVVSASVMTMGLIALPIMLRSGYDPRIAAGTIAASGTLSQIVPPSLVLIVMADQMGVPVGEMYRGAAVPALLLIGMFCLFLAAVAVFSPGRMPVMRGMHAGWREFLGLTAMMALGVGATWLGHRALGAAATTELRIVGAMMIGAAAAVVAAGFRPHGDFVRRAIMALVPTLGLIFLVLGTVFLGVATPTESGAMGAAGALLLAMARRRITLPALRETLHQTARLTVFVFFILIGARLFSLTFYGLGGDAWLHDLLLSLPGEKVGFIVFAMVVIFILGCFLDFFEIAFIVVPLLLPTAVVLNIDPLWFGILISMNLQTSFLTPPFGFALFYLRSVAPRPAGPSAPPGVDTAQIYTGPLPFVALNVALIGIVIAWPELVILEPIATEGTGTELIAPAASGGTDDSSGGNLNHLFD
ncbi:TRAP transporter, DctM subunit [Salinihabitans flavidus]|uniref:TRAP transporter, DctM subunit n=1 Tax=Salinihabitans flavidus TaxID=569882 RepID=A0A1H8WA01_9RHOB|nr:TRAP transporter large permease subunit [Salinihabitans flavidus]SEP24482.1 TRAP transporter, DctM subunit [Salinihabitans flavidus]